MSINLKKRMITGPKTTFVSCTQLPIREDIIFRQDLVSYNGGNGKGGGSRSSAGRVAQVVGDETYRPDDGGVTRRMVQTMEAAVLSNPAGRDPNEPNWLVELRDDLSDFEESCDNALDELGDLASQGWDRLTN